MESSKGMQVPIVSQTTHVKGAHVVSEIPLTECASQPVQTQTNAKAKAVGSVAPSAIVCVEMTANVKPITSAISSPTKVTKP